MQIIKPSPIEKISIKATRWIGSTASLILHTIIFLTCFVSVFLGTPIEKMLLVLTTIVSLEAIYLSIFIQMSVNRNEQNLAFVSKDVEEIAEDVQEIQEDVEEIAEDVENIEKDIDEIQEDVDEIQEDVEEIQEEVTEEDERGTETDHKPIGHPEILGKIQHVLETLARDVEALKKKEEEK